MTTNVEVTDGSGESGENMENEESTSMLRGLLFYAVGIAVTTGATHFVGVGAGVLSLIGVGVAAYYVRDHTDAGGRNPEDYTHETFTNRKLVSDSLTNISVVAFLSGVWLQTLNNPNVNVFLAVGVSSLFLALIITPWVPPENR